MNAALLKADITARLEANKSLLLSVGRRESLFEKGFSDIQQHELILIMKFLGMYKADFIEKYQIPETLMSIDYDERFTMPDHLKKAEDYFKEKKTTDTNEKESSAQSE